VDSIGVLEARRNQGIGTLMLNLFAEWAKTKGAPYIMLNVAVENDSAIRVYEKNGFKTMMLYQRKLI
jgi:ribosomal protein S18 acetylase RimI-like enzyme